MFNLKNIKTKIQFILNFSRKILFLYFVGKTQSRI